MRLLAPPAATWLAAIFGALAGEAGLTLTPATERKAAAVLARVEADHGSGNARLAGCLLDQVAAAQARRVTAESRQSERRPG